MKKTNYFIVVTLLATTIFSACKPTEPKNEPKTEIFTVGEISFTMVRVKAGAFTMGANKDDALAYEWEKPAHKVTLTDDYFIGETEVTQGLWETVMGENPSYFKTKGANFPVEHVNWNDIQEFLTKLNQKTGKTFRLPTEAEWEYAARGGSQSKGYLYSGSNDLDTVAWYYDNARKDLALDDPNYGTHAVKTNQANELGLYDMSGNVWEWCNDWFAAYSSEPQINPQGAVSGPFHVYRGGSWYDIALLSRVSYRFNFYPGNRYFFGFRLAQNIK